jgi:hypothetical protein
VNSSVTIATWGLAIVAALAFGVNIWQAVQSSREVGAANSATQAAGRQAKASEAQAEATIAAVTASLRQAEASERLAAEAQRTRELEWEPLLTFIPAGPVEPARVRNDGRGPAYRVVVCIRSDGYAHFSAPPVSIGPGSKRSPGSLYNSSPLAAEGLIPHGSGWVIFCEDHFGNRYKFRDKGMQPEVFTRDETAARVWTDIYIYSEPTRAS